MAALGAPPAPRLMRHGGEVIVPLSESFQSVLDTLNGLLTEQLAHVDGIYQRIHNYRENGDVAASDAYAAENLTSQLKARSVVLRNMVTWFEVNARPFSVIGREITDKDALLAALETIRNEECVLLEEVIAKDCSQVEFDASFARIETAVRSAISTFT